MVKLLKDFSTNYDPAISDIEVMYGPEREGDIPHSHASIDKAKTLLGYEPEYNLRMGLKEAIKWYWDNL